MINVFYITSYSEKNIILLHLKTLCDKMLAKVKKTFNLRKDKWRIWKNTLVK